MRRALLRFPGAGRRWVTGPLGSAHSSSPIGATTRSPIFDQQTSLATALAASLDQGEPRRAADTWLAWQRQAATDVAAPLHPVQVIPAVTMQLLRLAAATYDGRHDPHDAYLPSVLDLLSSLPPDVPVPTPVALAVLSAMLRPPLAPRALVAADTLWPRLFGSPSQWDASFSSSVHTSEGSGGRHHHTPTPTRSTRPAPPDALAFELMAASCARGLDMFRARQWLAVQRAAGPPGPSLRAYHAVLAAIVQATTTTGGAAPDR